MSPVGRLHKRARTVARPAAPSPTSVAAPTGDAWIARTRLLVVDGAADALARTTFLLAAGGYGVSTARSVAEGWRLVVAERPALVVVGARLPHGAGLALLQRLSAAPPDYRPVSILLLGPTARNEDRLHALALGADACLLPDAPDAELVVRAHTLLRHATACAPPPPAPPLAALDPPPPDEVHEAGPLWVNATRREARLGGAALRLTRTEFELLRLLAARLERPVSTEEARGIASGTGARVKAATVRTHVFRLRAKLGAYADMIALVPRRGYVLRPRRAS